jgi:hypothetical protein
MNVSNAMKFARCCEANRDTSSVRTPILNLRLGILTGTLHMMQWDIPTGTLHHLKLGHRTDTIHLRLDLAMITLRLHRSYFRTDIFHLIPQRIMQPTPPRALLLISSQPKMGIEGRNQSNIPPPQHIETVPRTLASAGFPNPVRFFAPTLWCSSSRSSGRDPDLFTEPDSPYNVTPDFPDDVSEHTDSSQSYVSCKGSDNLHDDDAISSVL